MNKLLKYLIYLLFASLIAGPLGVIPLGIVQVNIYFADIVIGIIGLIWVSRVKDFVKIVKTDAIAKYFLAFVIIAIISLIFSPINLTINERFISGLYSVRLLAYFSVYLTVKQLVKVKTISVSIIEKLLVAAGLILAALGWVQYFLYADLRNLYYLGWDPHFARIFSTYLDPNYFGLIMILTLVISVWRKLTWQSIIIFATLMFTYSRSSYLAVVVSSIYFFYQKRKYGWIAMLIIIMFITIILLPRPAGVGVQLERVFSIETRIENWQQAFKIFADHPVLGIGFNTIRYAKIRYNLPQDNLAESHAGAGFDNSFLFVAATTGMVGLLSYLFFLRKISEKSNLLVRTTLVAIIIHSFFLNSLFFPWVMVWMWILVAATDYN